MHGSISTLLESVHIHEPQKYEHITVFPLTCPAGEGPDYLSLDEAIEAGQMVITERSEGGSVPELIAVNKASQPVLIVSGDELIGAKQNRIVNVSILLKSGTRVIIPVSCSERGRWHYSSRTFRSSKFMSSPSLRKKKMETVTFSLRQREERFSDQSGIWNKIDDDARRIGVRSKTGAYSDLMETRVSSYAEILGSFALIPDQTGIFVFAAGRPLLLEFISKPAVYAHIHRKALSGCLLDALHIRDPNPVDERPREVFAAMRACEESEHPAIGDGVEIRFRSRETEGAALVVDGEPVHVVSCWEPVS